jgi:hypothetical protein
MHEHDELILAEHHGAKTGLGWLEREHAEIEAALSDLGPDLPCRDAANVHVHEGMRLSEPRDDRQYDVHRGLVGADEHAAATQVAQVTDGAFGLFGEAQETLGVIAQQASGVGQCGVLRGAVEQAFADTFFETADSLTDGRLRPVQFHGRPREAAFGGDLEKDAQFAEFHGVRARRAGVRLV